MTKYANVPDLTNLPEFTRSTVAGWIDTEAEPYLANGTVDEVYLPIEAEDDEQLQARVELLEEGKFGVSVRVKEGPVPSTKVEEGREAVQEARESIQRLANNE